MRKLILALIGLTFASCELLLPDLGKVYGDAGSGGVSGDPCEDAEDCESGNCQNGVCCPQGGVCCNQDAHCSDNLACNLTGFECYTECGPGGEDFDYACAAGYHCDANVCFEDIVLGTCDENSDCVSQECITGYCCQHAGLCCGEDEDCPDLFDGCADDDSRTCVFSTYTVAHTGQTDCYDVNGDPIGCDSISPGNDYYGQDGHVSGQQQSFTDLADGTIQDDNTGLIWTQTDGGAVDYVGATTHCSELTLAGHSWRLPLRHELQYIVLYSSDTTMGLVDAFSVSDGTGDFWTGTDLAGAESSTAWTVDVAAGTVARTGKDSTSPRVLCVAEE